MRLEQTFKIGIREIGMSNKITNYGFLAFLEDIATVHSDLVGYGIKDRVIRKGAWLLMDWGLEVKNRLPFNSKIKVITYAVSQEKPSYHSYRNFEIYDENNNLIATATSKWLYYNFETKRITKIDEDMMRLYNPEGNIEESEKKLTKLVEQSTYENMTGYEVKRSDLDINEHVNNLNYLKLAYEILPEDVYFGEEPNNLRITYKHQIKLGSKIKCFYTYTQNKHCIAIKSEDEKILHSIIELW